MPTYDYRCDDCADTFEIFQSMMDDPLKNCPKCGGSHVKRLISGGSGIMFKGDGFYVNDSKKSAEKPCASAPACPSGGACAHAKE